MKSTSNTQLFLIMQINREQLLQNTVTGLLTVVAVIYAAGERTGAYYFENQEEIHEDLRVFFDAVKTGTSNAVSVTLQLGRDARVAYDELYPVVAPKVVALYKQVKVRHNELSDYLRAKLNLD